MEKSSLLKEKVWYSRKKESTFNVEKKADVICFNNSSNILGTMQKWTLSSINSHTHAHQRKQILLWKQQNFFTCKTFTNEDIKPLIPEGVLSNGCRVFRLPCQDEPPFSSSLNNFTPIIYLQRKLKDKRESSMK